jgi:hypothetical protein
LPATATPTTNSAAGISDRPTAIQDESRRKPALLLFLQQKYKQEAPLYGCGRGTGAQRLRRSIFPPNKDTSLSVIYECRRVVGEIAGPSRHTPPFSGTRVPPVLSGQDQVFLTPSFDNSQRIATTDLARLHRNYGVVVARAAAVHSSGIPALRRPI